MSRKVKQPNKYLNNYDTSHAYNPSELLQPHSILHGPLNEFIMALQVAHAA